MKFLTLEQGQLGALLSGEAAGDVVVDIPMAASELGVEGLPANLAALVDAGDAIAEQVWQLARHAQQQSLALRAYAEVRPQAPIAAPRRNILCLGKNYIEHAKEVAGKMNLSGDAPDKPIIFTKATTAVIGPGDTIPRYSELTQKLDYEAELALIIGREGRDINPDNAWDYVFGYTAFNDVSARDLQKDHLQWFRAKSLDGFAPMGPLVVHRSAIPPLEQLRVSCRVNGELRQDDSLDRLIFDVPQIIACLSAGMTLLPGDIIATGTPAGVGMGFRPSKYLQSGDGVVVEVSGAGQLKNRVGD